MNQRLKDLLERNKDRAPLITGMILHHIVEGDQLSKSVTHAQMIAHAAQQMEELIELACKLEAQANAKAPALTFAQLSNVNLERAKRWHKGGLTEWSVAEWTNAMCGEAGEAANAGKKMLRIEKDMQQHGGDSGVPIDMVEAAFKVAKEVADTVIYGDLVCARVGLSLEAMVRQVFNMVSEREGFPERLP